MTRATTSRFLVTTALEASWNTSRPILFLGEWCRMPARRHAWESLDAVVGPYHWDDREKFFRDYTTLEDGYERALRALSEKLGELHGVTSDTRYWRIIIGPWLRFFADAVYDRFETVRLAQESKAFDDTWLLSYRLTDWTPADEREFYGDFTGDGWNHIVFAEAIRTLEAPCSEHTVALNPPRRERVTRQGSGVRRFAGVLLRAYGRALPGRLNRVAFIEAGIGDDRLWRLQRELRQLPYLRSPIVRTPDSSVDLRRRERLRVHLGSSCFDRLLENLIPVWLPRAYVESFSALCESAHRELPKHPSAIVTGMAYQHDDAFKAWAAHHTMKGVPLVIIQHGGNMGIGRVHESEDHQVRIASTFSTWGWTRADAPSVRPLPSLKISGRRIPSSNSGEILMTLASYPRYYYCHYCVPAAGQVLGYVEQQLRFISALNPILTEKLKLRLDPSEYGWDVPGILSRAGYSRLIERVDVGLLRRLSSCRVAVATYNASIFLETLAANFPTLVFMDPTLFETRPAAEPLLQQLRTANILHDTPESAAQMLNEHGADVNAWWQAAEVQRAREEFCWQYARSAPEWASQWGHFLRDLTRPGHVTSTVQ